MRETCSGESQREACSSWGFMELELSALVALTVPQHFPVFHGSAVLDFILSVLLYHSRTCWLIFCHGENADGEALMITVVGLLTIDGNQICFSWLLINQHAFLATN